MLVKVKGIIRVVSAIVILMILLNIIPFKEYEKENPWKIKRGDRPLVIAHGGAKKLYPENTILAYNEVVNLGVDILEIDLCLTKDGELITHHDLTIDKTSNGSGKVRDYTYDELMTFDFAYNFKNQEGFNPYKGNVLAKPTTLSDLFMKYEEMRFIIEIKDKGEDGKEAANRIRKLIDMYDMKNQVLVATFHDDVNEHVKISSDYSLYTAAPSGITTRFVLLEKLKLGVFFNPQDAVIELPITATIGGDDIDLTSTQLINGAHRHNIAIYYWTVNDPDQMQQLINDGVDGIITDRPDLLNKVLKEMGY